MSSHSQNRIELPKPSSSLIGREFFLIPYWPLHSVYLELRVSRIFSPRSLHMSPVLDVLVGSGLQNDAILGSVPLKRWIRMY